MSDTIPPKDEETLYQQGWTDGVNEAEPAHPDNKDYMDGYGAGWSFIEHEDSEDSEDSED